jgi:3',5'-cyclic AMP phosphodiesterase CpdA
MPEGWCLNLPKPIPLHSGYDRLNITVNNSRSNKIAVGKIGSEGVSIMERKSRNHLTLAHISDLHTPTAGVEPRRRLADFKEPLIDDLLQHKVDILVVTGDVADSPIVSTIGVIRSYFDGRETQLLIDSLAATLAAARTTLEDICQAANIDPEDGLCVIPGNHDLRIQGVLTGNNTYEQDASNTFEEVFDRYYRTRRLHSTYKGGGTIHTTIVPFNSNTNQAAVNFSSGGITSHELRKFGDFLRTDNARSNSPPDSVFKICLVHHHPLPVGTAERPEPLKKQRDGGVRAALCRFVWNATALPDGRRGAKRVRRQVLQA